MEASDLGFPSDAKDAEGDDDDDDGKNSKKKHPHHEDDEEEEKHDFEEEEEEDQEEAADEREEEAERGEARARGTFLKGATWRADAQAVVAAARLARKVRGGAAVAADK